jgi:hypothetical protein
MDQHSPESIPSKRGRNRTFRVLEIGEVKWCKEHITHKDNDLNDITEDGISLLDDTELWGKFQQPLQATGIYDRTNNFPSNYWRHKVTKGKDDLPIQTLGQVQHQCETLSKIHTLTHHRC